MTIETIGDSHQVDDSTYNSSTIPGEKQSIFLRRHWFECFENHIASENSSVWLNLTEHKQKKILPLLKENKQKGIFGIKSLHSMSNYYSPVYGMLDNDINEIISAEHLDKSSIKLLTDFDSINISPLIHSQATGWLATFREIGFYGHLYQHSVNWYHDNIVDIDHYWSLRPPRLLNTLRRKRDQMTKDGGFATKIYSSGTLPELITALIDYHHVYFHSWKQKEPYPAFIDAIAEQAWDNNELRLGVIYHNEKPVAAQIWFVCNTSAYIFKLAHVEDYTKFSPGTVLMAELLKHVIEIDRVTCVDFLTGNDSYKKDWMSNHRPLYGIHLCNTRTLKGQLLSLLNFAGKLGKKLHLLREKHAD
ncbi:GNAT family N-acetyltransferase [Arsukibacterium sp.]|uniref:GNAT family N-acetyltransferase n=1 Tax=Arsukibacterium sp. TaxID=1977258 RepID=UPI001BD1F9CC|nr:GNAT family N-acetyltransferase [Arsukibacterium sp.]